MKYALVIGNERYEDPKLAQLKTPGADTWDFAHVLQDKTIGSFDEVTPLINKTESEARRSVSTFFANKKPDDLVLVYFSGHGVLDDRGRLFLALKDTQTNLLNATAIPSTFISDEMDRCRSRRQILILDCCHSGAFARGTKAGEQKAVTEATFEGNGYGRIILTASDSTQYALEGDQVISQTELSLFTHYLLKGLKTGHADTNNDGVVSLDEWYEYAYAQVLSTTPKQVPHKWSYHQQGDLIIAKNPFGKKGSQDTKPDLIKPVSPPRSKPKPSSKKKISIPLVGSSIMIGLLCMVSIIVAAIKILPFPKDTSSTEAAVVEAPATELPETEVPSISQDLVLQWSIKDDGAVLELEQKYWEKYEADTSIPGLYLRSDNINAFGDFLELNSDGTFTQNEVGVAKTGNWKIEGNKLTLIFP